MDRSFLDGQRAAQTLLAEGDLPTGLVAYNDDTAAAAIGQFIQHGIDVPGRISITGFDDSEILATSPIGVTTVVQRADEMGRLAVERIIDRVHQRRIVGREIVLPAEPPGTGQHHVRRPTADDERPFGRNVLTYELRCCLTSRSLSAR